MPPREPHLSEQPPPTTPPPNVRPRPRTPPPSPDQLISSIKSQNTTALARAITLAESAHPSHQNQANHILAALTSSKTSSLRIGITGIPGAGKSTLIERLGLQLINQKHRVAVLAVDPTSSRTGGSILGDKTRMPKLAASQSAFIRPSPAGKTLGGVAAKTREAILLCEAANFDIILVETVGVGQSETMVADMTDHFLALMTPAAGDELQAVKRGLIELADTIAVNKADGELLTPAKLAAAHYKNAIHYMTQPKDTPNHTPHTKVLTISAATGLNLDTLWQHIHTTLTNARNSNTLQQRRHQQNLRWLDNLIDAATTSAARNNPTIARAIQQATDAVEASTQPPTRAAQHVIQTIHSLLNPHTPS